MYIKCHALRRMFVAGAVCAISSILLTSPSHAQTSKWPDKPVRIVVPFAPGGSNDVIARRLADSLRQSLGQPFLIENKPGAGSVVGANYVAQAAKDGYTILFVSGSLATTAGVQKTPYDAKLAFEPITTVPRQMRSLRSHLRARRATPVFLMFQRSKSKLAWTMS